MDNIFNTYTNSLKNYKKHSISEPIEIDFSKVKTFTDIIYREDNNLNYNSLLFENNFWNQSPYVASYFSKKVILKKFIIMISKKLLEEESVHLDLNQEENTSLQELNSICYQIWDLIMIFNITEFKVYLEKKCLFRK